MDRRNQRNRDIVETAATVAAGAAAAYGCYKVCQSLFDNNNTSEHTVDEFSANQRRRNSPPSFGTTVSNIIGGMQLAHSGFKLCESLLEALPKEEPRPTPTSESSRSIHYPDLTQYHDRAIQPTRNETSARPPLSGAELFGTMLDLYGEYRRCNSLLNSDDSSDDVNSSAFDGYQPNDCAVVVETSNESQKALKKIKE